MSDDTTSPSSAGRERLYLWLGIVGIFLILCMGFLCLYGVGRLILQLIAFLKSLDPQIAAPIIAASWTVLAAVLAVVIGQVYTKRRELEEVHRQKKTDLYKSFVNKTNKVLKEMHKGGEIDPQFHDELVEYFQDFHAELSMWASPKVLKAYQKWNELAVHASNKETGDTSSAHSVLAMDDLIRSFRSDLGLKNRGLGQGDLVQVYLKAGEMQKILEKAK